MKRPTVVLLTALILAACGPSIDVFVSSGGDAGAPPDEGSTGLGATSTDSGGDSSGESSEGSSGSSSGAGEGSSGESVCTLDPMIPGLGVCYCDGIEAPAAECGVEACAVVDGVCWCDGLKAAAESCGAVPVCVIVAGVPDDQACQCDGEASPPAACGPCGFDRNGACACDGVTAPQWWCGA